MRCVGDSWPMTRERAYFEASTLREHGRLCPEHTPEVYHFDRAMSLMGMRYIEPPHIILRKGLIVGVEYPLLADHVSDYMAKTLFFTSLLYNNSTDHIRKEVSPLPPFIAVESRVELAPTCWYVAMPLKGENI